EPLQTLPRLLTAPGCAPYRFSSHFLVCRGSMDISRAHQNPVGHGPDLLRSLQVQSI
ncbi:unnamed protein product, partial [Bubo scandiacus]